jgi:hypothetical protein
MPKDEDPKKKKGDAEKPRKKTASSTESTTSGGVKKTAKKEQKTGNPYDIDWGAEIAAGRHTRKRSITKSSRELTRDLEETSKNKK